MLPTILWYNRRSCQLSIQSGSGTMPRECSAWLGPSWSRPSSPWPTRIAPPPGSGGNLVRSVASAASKEIKVSMDTATFVAHTFNTLHKIWQRGLLAEGVSEGMSLTFLMAMQFFLGTMVQSLGMLPFTEKMLSMNKQNSFVPITTPSSRPGKHQTPPKTPLHHLFSILSTLPPGVADDGELYKFIKLVLDPFFSGKNEQAQKALAQEFLSSAPMDDSCPSGPWRFATEKLQKWLEPKQSSHPPSSSESQPLAGHDYRDVVRVLERGIRSTPNLPGTNGKPCSLFLRAEQKLKRVLLA